MMNSLTFSQVRADLKNVMDQVCQTHAPTVITRGDGEPVVMLSLADYNSMAETLHLMSSAKNASRLLESIAQLQESKAKQRQRKHHVKQEATKQAANIAWLD